MRTFLIALLFSLIASPAFSQETGMALRQTEIRKEPYTDADKIGMLQEKAQVKVIKRQGGWLQIESGAPSGTLAGWVRMLSIRMGTNNAQSSDWGMKSLFNVARTGSSGTTVTTGVRGLDKEQIANAKPNPAELQKLTAYAATKPDAEQFARSGPELKPQSVPYLPESR